MIRKLSLGGSNVVVNTIGLSVLTKILWPPRFAKFCLLDKPPCMTSHACLRCQAENKRDLPGRQDCVVVWGECNHSFHHCCMSLWVKQNNRCPLCQQEWSIQRMGK
uniref:RING-type domain-containing protein n=1 Tax=Glossina palpalis gambiensis TaxID=67801 RepID=A0A1B0BKQ5_9MUSC